MSAIEFEISCQIHKPFLHNKKLPREIDAHYKHAEKYFPIVFISYKLEKSPSGLITDYME